MMKKLFFLMTLCITLVWYSHVEAMQIRPICGYGLGIGAINVYLGDGGVGGLSADTLIDSSGRTTKNENVYYSGGAGLHMGLGILLPLNRNLGVELGGGMVMGSEKYLVSMNDASTTNSVRWSADSSYIPIELTVKLSTEIGRFVPYVGFGPTLAAGGKTVVNGSYRDSTDNLTEMTWEYTYKTTLGINAQLGADFKITDSISFFGGLVLRSLSLKLEKGKKTKHTLNGADQMGSQTTSQKEVEFVENYVQPTTVNPNEAAKANTFPMPFHSLSFNAGIALSF